MYKSIINETASASGSAKLSMHIVLFFVFFWNASRIPRDDETFFVHQVYFGLACFLQGDLVVVGILSGNRNFEGRIHPLTRANYLASPPLVIAYAIAGTTLIDFEKEPLGK